MPAHVHQFEIIERLIRAGIYMGPINCAIAGYGAGTLERNPFDWMGMVRRTPQGAVATFWSSMRGLILLSALALVLGQHIRVGNQDNIWRTSRMRSDLARFLNGCHLAAKFFSQASRIPEAPESKLAKKIQDFVHLHMEHSQRRAA